MIITEIARMINGPKGKVNTTHCPCVMESFDHRIKIRCFESHLIDGSTIKVSE